jgi:hypothetical protein
VNTADILDKAADLIAARGLAKRVHCNQRGGLCAAGAIYAATGIEPVAGVRNAEAWPTYNPAGADATSAAYDWLRAWLLREDPDVTDPVSWNDGAKRSKEEVVSTLRAAAQAARADQ